MAQVQGSSTSTPVLSRYSNHLSIEWRWDIAKHRLDIDVERCRQVLNADLPSLTGNVLMPCMSYHDQTILLEKLTKLKPQMGLQRFNCCLRLESDQCCYVEMTFQSDDGKLASGHLTPLFFFQATALSIGALFGQLFNNAHHGVLLIDAERSIIVCNDNFLSLSGYANSELKGQPFASLQSDRHSANFYTKIWCEIERSGHWSGVMLLQSAQGRAYPQDVTIQRIMLEEGIFYVAVLLDLSNNIYRIEDVEHGGVELLTQLPTQTQFIRAVTYRSQREGSEKVTMVVAFQPPFDHTEDFELKALLSEHLTKEPQAVEVGYLGSNHFVACVECNKVKGPSQVRLIHQSIRRFFSSINQHVGTQIYNAIMAGRIGVSVLGQDTHDPKLLVAHSVQAMLEHSVTSRGQITFYHGVLHKQVLRRKELEEWAEKTIKTKDVEVYYQPIVDTKNWDVVKFEALSRFKGPNGQMLNTQEMVSIAEDLDLVADLDWCVGQRALQDLNHIQERFGQHLGVTINRSLNTKLDTDEVLASADSLVHKYAKRPETVTIELTESAYFDSESRQSSLIRNIRRRGVQVAIDDFGTGYSSFSYLSDSNFDVIKIDKEFVTDLMEGTNKYYIVKMITQLAHTLNVKVVAEGVETRNELEAVCSLGVDYIQGYYFSKPLPIHDLENAWDYCEDLEQFLSGKGRKLKSNILSITQVHLPCLSPDDTIERARSLLTSEQYNLEVIPVLDRNVCVGVVGLEEVNLHLSPTAGTKFETRNDIVNSRKTLNQVMRRNIHTLTLEENNDQVSETLRQGIRPPWLVVNSVGEYLGVVTHQNILSYFTDS